jgi:energy-coupling factor transporter ATP-binding protein EcfA2
MRIQTFEIANFKSYKDSGLLHFSTGFNLLVGQNNVGKSALLEALSLKFPPKPHRSLLTVPRPTSPVNPTSLANVVLTLSGEELRDILLSINGQFYVPVPTEHLSKGHHYGLECLNGILALKEVSFSVALQTDNAQMPNVRAAIIPSHGLYKSVQNAGDSGQFYAVVPTPDKTNFISQNITNAVLNSDFGVTVAHYLRDRIYSFRAERFNVGVSPVGIRNVLEPNSTNLPEVLSVLQGNNPARFAKFNEYVRRIFPAIYQISVRNIPNNQSEITTWTENPVLLREDLAVPLAESGTGVGQVLAILYVVLTSEFPRTILIDEPNSFLHPAAARKLIEILRVDFPIHQYIVATHSPEIIRTANPSTLFLVGLKGRESILERLDAGRVTDVSKCLLEVGARLSDVFGSDEILWVEGDTEETCYRLIADRLGNKLLLGKAIVAVRNVGELESRRPSAKLIWEIYTKLSASNSLIPPAIAFIFDREQRTQQEIQDLIDRSGGKLKFIHRRMYENYLLIPDAIQAVMSQLPSFSGATPSVGQIKEWIEANGGRREYVNAPSDRVDITNPVWLESVNGARLLHDLLASLSNNTEEYRKTVHSVALTEWLIANKPEALSELKELLLSVLSS